MIDKNKIKDGHINNENGEVLSSSYKNIMIPVEESANYVVSGMGDNLTPHNAYYDADYKYVSAKDTSVCFKTPSGVAFLGLTILADAVNTVKMEKGTVVTPYESYRGYKIDANLLNIYENDNVFSEDNIPVISGSKIYGKINDEVLSCLENQNKFDKTKITKNSYINFSTGTVMTGHATYCCTDYIPIKKGQVYSFLNFKNQHFAKYDLNNNFVATAINNIENTFTSDVDGYIRFTLDNEEKANTAMLVEGEFVPSYVPYGYKIKSDYIKEVNRRVDAFLPEELYVASGVTIEIYNNQVVVGDITDLNFCWDCEVGKSMKRKFTVTGNDKIIGNHNLTLKIYDNGLNLLWSKTITLKVVSNNLTTNKSILTIGDSLSNDKAWYGEVRKLSNNKISFVGTRGETENLKHEGRSGFSAKAYLTRTPYTFYANETEYHKFWDDALKRFNYNLYKTTYNINPDAVQIFLGTNGIQLDSTENVQSIKQIVDYIRKDDTNIKIYVVNTLYRGNQDGIGNTTNTDGYSSFKGQFKLEEDKKVFNLMRDLCDALKNYDNLFFVPIALTHDSEYNFGAVDTPVNPRSTITEKIPVESVHPQDSGYFQFADCMYSVYCGTFF